MPSETEDTMDYPPLKGAALVWITLSLGLAVFMEVLDTTIANVAVPVIAGNLGAATTHHPTTPHRAARGVSK